MTNTAKNLAAAMINLVEADKVFRQAEESHATIVSLHLKVMAERYALEKNAAENALAHAAEEYEAAVVASVRTIEYLDEYDLDEAQKIIDDSRAGFREYMQSR